VGGGIGTAVTTAALAAATAMFIADTFSFSRATDELVGTEVMGLVFDVEVLVGRRDAVVETLFVVELSEGVDVIEEKLTLLSGSFV